MAEVLSQQEIDQLLNSINSGGDKPANEEIDKEVVPYDFRLPNRISKTQLRTLKNIHENFCESLGSFLMSKLQTVVNINIISVDQIYYSEYVLSVSNPACLFKFNIKGSDVKAVLELSPELAIALVDRLLGGNGKGAKQSKLITPIEQKVLFVFVERVMADLKKSWQIIGNYEFMIEKFEPDIDFAQITSQSESVLIISFEIFIGENPYLMNICFATYAFDAILSKLNSQNFSTIRPSSYNGSTAKELLLNNLKKTELNVMVEFGNALITVDELINLEKGDVILTNKKIGDEYVVKVERKNLFVGQAGVVNGHKGIKITQRIEEEE